MRSLLVVTPLLSVLACSSTAGESAPPSPAPRPPAIRDAGAPGIGDPDFPTDGNGGYDVTRYRLRLAYDPAGRDLDGTATIQATATQPLDRFNLDLSGLTVRTVTVNDRRATYRREGDELVVTPAAPIAKATRFVTEISYAGRPQPLHDATNLGTYGFIPTEDGAFVVCEPNGAKTWFPANDHPADKARFDFQITVPKGLTALANGEMTKPPRTAKGKTTYTWREKHPMATYLATMTLGKFVLREGRTASGIPNLTAADPRFSSALNRLYRATGKITDYWATVFGPYPFSSTGGVVDNFPAGYALENQTKPMYGGFDPDESIVAHELAHQWFGNSLTITRWRDLWLNEGFSTYAEWLWSEHSGKSSAESIYATFLARPASDPIWSYPPGSARPDDLFNESVYTRGAMTLHALRKEIGDTAFFTLLRDWADQGRYGNVRTEQFVRLAEKISGKRLDAFFSAWLYQARRPAQS